MTFLAIISPFCGNEADSQVVHKHVLEAHRP